MSTRLSPRFATLALCGILVVAALVGYFVPTTDALPANEIYREFYSDASHSNWIGERYVLCNGTRGGWGTVSSFYVIYTFPCS